MIDFSSHLLLPSPIEVITHPSLEDFDGALYIKREDIIHKEFGGNKWRKLVYNLHEFDKGNYSHIVTLGGPFSNHIAATAQACFTFGYPSVGIIRGRMIDPNNPTLNKAKEAGMELRHISKEEYRIGNKSEVVNQILNEYPQPYFIPEGGSNQLAINGVSELMNEVHQQEERFDTVVVAAGTGTTAAGIIRESKEEVIVINVLKNQSLHDTIVSKLNVAKNEKWQVNHDYHFGGFAKTTEELISFINRFKTETGIQLDPVYTGKAMYATLDLIAKKQLEGRRILFVHTGGLQGIIAYNYIRKNKSKIS